MLRICHEQTFTNGSYLFEFDGKKVVASLFRRRIARSERKQILQIWEVFVSMCEEKELVPMYRLKLYCRDWWETDMKTTAWKSKMMRMT